MSSVRYNVRLVRLSDEPVVLRLGREAVDTTDYRSMTYSPSHVAHTLKQCVEQPDKFFGLVGELEGEVVGYKCAFATIDFFSSDIVCFDISTYITPAGRSIILVATMMVEYKKWATRIGACRAYLGATAASDDPRVGMLFTKLGFRYAGTLHVAEIDHGQRSGRAA